MTPEPFFFITDDDDSDRVLMRVLPDGRGAMRGSWFRQLDTEGQVKRDAERVVVRVTGRPCDGEHFFEAWQEGDDAAHDHWSLRALPGSEPVTA